MTALSTILPVFFMVALGILARTRHWVTPEQADGLNAVVGKVFFPIMVFNALFTAALQPGMLWVVGFVLLAHLAALGVGWLLRKATGGPYAHIAPYLMATVDGGNVCYPLYATLVGSGFIGNVVLLDLACMLVVFLAVPVLVARRTAQRADPKALLRQLLRTPLVLCMALGAALNALGLPELLQATGWLPVYENVAAMATGPIVGCILFTMGYRFTLQKGSMAPLLRCVALRAVLMAGVAALFFVLFPALTQDPAFRVLVPLYFLCPPALVLPTQVEPLFKTKADAGFFSAFISLYLLVTLTVYTALALLG